MSSSTKTRNSDSTGVFSLRRWTLLRAGRAGTNLLLSLSGGRRGHSAPALRGLGSRRVPSMATGAAH
jgi:hypothetical protein